uniref:ATP-dependent DNA ligase family profile domain-containing protein n=1 Tax=Ditylenchus dipsaci TaxID=166011 RepID=A0A915DQU5_9BILA
MSLTPGKCFKPMLAHPSKGIDEVLKKFGGKDDFACEWKYDGERIQVHRTQAGKVQLFSRNQLETTNKYPDVVERLSKCLAPGTKDFIADGEVVAWDVDKATILPFQTLSTRKRKAADSNSVKVQVVIFLFDLIYVNGKSLVDLPFRQRRQQLHQKLIQVPGSVFFVTSMDTKDPEEIGDFLQDAVRGSCEGLMLKTLDSPYLVVIGGYNGEGRRQTVYGAYLLAVYDSKSKEYQTICKVGTGFTDNDLRKQFKEFGKLRIKEPLSNYAYHRSLEPDFWFEPKVVWEIKAYGLTISPRHCAAKGLVDPAKGLSLRFPRFLRVRDDKKVEDATGPEQLNEMYKKQEDVANFVYKPADENDDEEEDIS